MKIEITKKTLGVIIAIIVVIVGIAAASMLLTTEEIEDDPTVEHELTINTEGEGETLPETGTHTYTHGTEIPVTATPEEDWIFQEWTGDQESTEEEIQITMDSDKEITAHFKEEDEEIERAKFKPEIISPREIDPMPLEREVQVLYSVTNTDEIQDTQTVEFKVNEETIDSREHTLQPGETQQNTFTWTPQQEEEKTITLETLNIIESQQITIKEYPDPETPGEVVEAYVWFLDHALLEEMEKLSTGERKQYFEQLTEEDREGIKYSSRNSNNTVEVIEEKIDEDTATVEAEVTWEASREHEDYEETSNRTYHLQQEQQQWKIAEIE